MGEQDKRPWGRFTRRVATPGPSGIPRRDGDEGVKGQPGAPGEPGRCREQGSHGNPEEPRLRGLARRQNAPDENGWKLVTSRRSKGSHGNPEERGQFGGFVYSKEDANYFRLNYLVVKWGRFAMSTALDRAIRPKGSLPEVLGKLKPTFTELKSQGHLTCRQWHKFYPCVPSTVTSMTLDITDMMQIFRHADLLPSPANGWDHQPPRDDISTQADIVRVKRYRNSPTAAHSLTASISNEEFQKCWTEIEDTLVRLLDGKYRAEIHELKTAKIDPEEKKQNIKKMEKLNLEEVDSLNEGTGDDGAVRLAEGLKVNTTLKHLNKSGGNIGDCGAAAFAEALCVNHVLSHLDLSGNIIGNFGARAIAGALRENRSLRYLNLSGNRIGREGACELMDAFDKNEIIRYLDLRANECSNISGGLTKRSIFLEK